jgi:hypothetical protein
MTSTTCWVSLFHPRTAYRLVVRRSPVALESYTGEDNLTMMVLVVVNQIGAIGRTGVSATWWRRIMRVEREVCVSGDRESIDRQSVQEFRSFDLRWRRARSAEFCQTIRDEENEDNQGTVGRPLDLEVPEQRVSAKEIERLVDYVGL